MDTEKLIETEKVSIDGKEFMISCIPAVQAQEIYGQIFHATEGVGDLGMTFLPTPIAIKMLAYASVKDGEDCWVSLDSEEAINENVRNVKTLIQLEAAMIRKNFGFLFDGSLQKVLEALRKGEAGTSGQR